MSYRLSNRLILAFLLKILPRLLQDLNYVTIFISVGIHGLIWFLLPAFSLESADTNEPDLRRTVSLVELNPSEQSRLPDFSTPEVTLPPLPPESDFYSLTPQPRSFPSITNPAPLPPPLSRYPSSLPPLLTFPPTFPLSPRPGISLPRHLSPPPNPATPSPPAPTIQASPSPAPASPTPETSPSPTPESQAARLQPFPNEEPSPSASPSPDTAPQTNPTPDPLLAEQQRLQELYRYNAEGTNEGDGYGRLQQWFQASLGTSEEAIARATEDLDQLPRITITEPFPREGCPVRQETSPVVWFGVVVDADGKLVGEPSLLRSSGYGIFNSVALDLVKAYNYGESNADKPDYPVGDNRIYAVEVKFEGNEDDCPAITTPDSPPG